MSNNRLMTKETVFVHKIKCYISIKINELQLHMSIWTDSKKIKIECKKKRQFPVMKFKHTHT